MDQKEDLYPHSISYGRGPPMERLTLGRQLCEAGAAWRLRYESLLLTIPSKAGQPVFLWEGILGSIFQSKMCSYKVGETKSKPRFHLRPKGSLCPPFPVLSCVKTLRSCWGDHRWWPQSLASRISQLPVIITQSCPTLCDPMHCSPPGSSVYGIVQSRILDWIAIPFSRGSSWPRDRTCISWASCMVGGFFTFWVTGEVQEVAGWSLIELAWLQLGPPSHQVPWAWNKTPRGGKNWCILFS